MKKTITFEVEQAEIGSFHAALGDCEDAIENPVDQEIYEDASNLYARIADAFDAPEQDEVEPIEYAAARAARMFGWLWLVLALVAFATGQDWAGLVGALIMSRLGFIHADVLESKVVS